MNTAQHFASRTAPDSWGCVKVVCTCGWESAPTNRPQHLNRAFTSHKNDADKRAAKAAK